RSRYSIHPFGALLERVGEERDGGKPVVGIRQRRSPHDFVQPGGNLGAAPSRMVAVTARIEAAGRNPYRELTREGVVQRDAQGVFVRPRVAPPTGELLRRGIVGGADQTAGLGDGLLPRQPRRAEV